MYLIKKYQQEDTQEEEEKKVKFKSKQIKENKLFISDSYYHHF